MVGTGIMQAAADAYAAEDAVNKAAPAAPPVAEAAAKEEAAAAVEQDAPEKGAKAPPLGHYLAGRFAESQGDTQNGTKFIEEALKNDPTNKKTLSSLYRMYVLSGRLEEAEPIAKKLLGVKVVEDPSEFSPEMFLTLAHIRRGEYVKAEQYLQSVPKAGFNNLLAPILGAWINYGKGGVKTPFTMKETVTDPHMVLPHLYLNLAYINDLAGFKDVASEYYETSVKDERSQSFRAVEALANFYDRHGEKQKRKKLVDGYIAAHGETYLASELLLATAGKAKTPLVKDVNEGIAEAFYTIANLFHGVRAPADEIATLHFALYMRPKFPAGQFLLASAHELAEDYPTAVKTYKAIDQASPYFVRGRIRSLYDESEIGGDANVEESLAKLSALAEEMPKDIDALLAKGDIFRVRARYKEAVEAYTAAASRIKNTEKYHWIIFFSRGACLERLGRWDEAEADMKKALSLSPGEPDVLNYLGYSWLTKQQHINEARKMIEDAYEARPEDAHIIDSMGFALYVSGDFASAQEYFQQALERTPDDPTVNDHLGDTYWQLGRKTEARYQWNRALEHEKDEAAKHILSEKIEKGIAKKKPATQAAEDKKVSIELPADE